MSWIFLFLAMCYAALMWRYLATWQALPEWRLPEGWRPTQMLTVLVPARNEALHIEHCLRSILACKYPHDLLEIIVLDDFSEDGTADLALRLAGGSDAAIRVLRLAQHLPPEAAQTANKKRALEMGVEAARGTRILCTDADCLVPPDWLPLMASAPGALATGPVAFHQERNLLERFQSLDLLGLMGITGAGIHGGFQRMGNGANLAYDKAFFLSLGGYAGNRGTASGDDMFLIQKAAAQAPGSVFFVKNRAATVRTRAQPDWRGFWQQRLRWGTKNAALPEWPIRLALLAVFLFCWGIWLHAAALLCWGSSGGNVQVFVFQVFIKIVADYFFLRSLCRFFGRMDLLRWFLPAFVLHTAYIPLVGAGSLFLKNYRWKGRNVRR
jgi:cellulose synthase/poly-beta-1,6-N-acetylglucosamine synthase-like glycosyltransferase